MAKAKPEATPTTETRTAFKPVIVKHVTMPTLKLMPDVAVYVKITDPIFEGKSQPPKEGEEPKKAPMIFNVINLETGEVCQMVAGKVVEREIVDTYSDDAYVNRCFMIVKGKKKGTTDRGYFTYAIAEIEEPS